MASMNKVIIVGRLGKDPELRYTPSQTPVTTLAVATTEYRTSATGEKQETTEWHRITVWGRQAENVSKYLSKGSLALYEGSLKTNSWEDQNGQKRYSTEIVAARVQFLSPNKQNPGAYQQNNHGTEKDTGGGFPMHKMTPPDGPYGNIKADNTGNDKATHPDAQLPVIEHDSTPHGESQNLPF